MDEANEPPRPFLQSRREKRADDQQDPGPVRIRREDQEVRQEKHHERHHRQMHVRDLEHGAGRARRAEPGFGAEVVSRDGGRSEAEAGREQRQVGHPEEREEADRETERQAHQGPPSSRRRGWRARAARPR